MLCTESHSRQAAGAGPEPGVPGHYASSTPWASVSPSDSEGLSALSPMGGHRPYHTRGWSNGGTFTQPSLSANSWALRLASSQT